MSGSPAFRAAVPRPFHWIFRRPRRSAAALAALALLAGAPLAANDDADHRRPFSNQVGPGAYRLDGTDPELPLDDLTPLARIVGNARFVGLGESLHTSGGYYLMKHRLFRFLVEAMGFRVLGFESPWTWVEQLNAYVQTCEGTPEDAVNGLFTVYRSTEMADFARWMCEWNQAHPDDRVHVYGFDNQRQARANGEGLIAYLDELGVAPDHPWIAGIQACDGVTEIFWPSLPFPQERYEQCMGALGEIAAFFDAEERRLERATSREALAWGRIHLVGQQAWQEQLFFLRTDFARSYAARDRGMTHVALAIHELRFRHEKVALFAHNGHLWRNGLPTNDLLGMGDHLAAELGRRYVVIGQTALETHADWPTPGYCGPTDVLGPNPVEEELAAVGEPWLLIDLAPRGNHPALLPPGAVYSFQGTDPIVPADHMDAVVYHELSPAMHPLAWPACR